MKINKYCVAGILFIILAGVMFFTDSLTPYIRPVTYFILMGSTKGKDIIFFILIGIFLILSQLNINVKDSDKYLKLTIYVGLLALLVGIALELILRVELGLKWSTIFVGMKPNMCSTSVIHSHIYKTIFGHFFHETAPQVGMITEASSIYPYLHPFSIWIILFFPIVGILQLLAIQKRNFGTIVHLSIFFPCLLIAILDGGLFATPAYYGLFGAWIVYRNRYYIEKNCQKIFKVRDKFPLIEPYYRNHNRSELYFLFHRLLPYIIGIFMVFLRIVIMFVGTDPHGYEVLISNPTEHIELNKTYDTIEVINSTHYIIDPSYNEMELVISLRDTLCHRCDYYTVSENGYSYFR